MSNIAIITARGGSKRIPRKNIKDFLGKPIMAYSIEVALQSELFDDVMVSTDDEEIAESARKYGAKVPFMRSAENADDFSGTASVLLEVLETYQKQGKQFAYGCCLYPTAPFITVQRLKEGFDLLNAQALDSVFPVVRFSSPIQRALKKDEYGKVSMFYPENLMKRSQDLEPAYHDAGQFYFFNTQVLLEKKQVWTDNSGVLVLSDKEVQDIDTPEDWELAAFKYQWLKQR